ncbi:MULTISPECIES: helix-turn-helix domain-containing protein [Clostridium]|uniref:helix-turn-helix domain-containing protein n=1 Tax=Clostridium TaxID=1485 RepID=UPI000825A9CB|nr:MULTISPECIES: helix-turn-helix transcriptional regulator [Clostridium]PJI08715.1 tetratricopeptide repeat protein [Clostridium sp. CT7]
MGSYEILSIGTKLKNLREKYNVKQEDISGKEITRNLISQIEHDKANLTQNAAGIILKNLKNICDKRHITIDENIEFLMEDEKSQANKILSKYIKELKDLMVYKDNSFVTKLTEVEEFLVKWNITDKKIAIFELAGDYYCNINDYYKSSLYYEKAKALLDIYSKDSISILRKLSMVYFYMGEYGQNIKCCQFALDWFNDDLTEEYRCIFLFNSALCYLELKKYYKAIKNLTELELITKNLNMDKYYDVLAQEAVCYQELKKYNESLSIYNKLLGHMDKNKHELNTLILINTIEIYMELEDYTKAKNQLNKALDSINKLNDNCSAAPNIYFELGKIYKSLNDSFNSEKYFLKSLSLTKKQTHYYLMEDLILELANIYKSSKNMEKLSDIKNELFILTSKENNLNTKLAFKLMDLYIKSNDFQSVSEIVNFSKNFI